MTKLMNNNSKPKTESHRWPRLQSHQSAQGWRRLLRFMDSLTLRRRFLQSESLKKDRWQKGFALKIPTHFLSAHGFALHRPFFFRFRSFLFLPLIVKSIFAHMVAFLILCTLRSLPSPFHLHSAKLESPCRRRKRRFLRII